MYGIYNTYILSFENLYGNCDVEMYKIISNCIIVFIVIIKLTLNDSNCNKV